MRCLPLAFRASAFITGSILLSACRGVSTIGPSSGLPVANVPSLHAGTERLLPDGKHKIQHVIIIIQENRSFNNLFYGYPGAYTQSYGYDSKGKRIQLQPIPLETKWDLQHNGQGFIVSCNGDGKKIPGTKCDMNGFDEEYCRPKCPNKYAMYAYVPHTERETLPYFTMARQYVLADEMFASDWDTSSFISHQYIITAKAPEMAFNYPHGAWGCGGGLTDLIQTISLQRQVNGAVHPCWNPVTLGDELDKKGLSWAFYATPVTGGSSHNG
jgi:phospholipase C